MKKKTTETNSPTFTLRTARSSTRKLSCAYFLAKIACHVP